MTIDQNHRPLPFLVGNHLALDFVNTRATPAGAPIEWLCDGADLVDWLEQAGAIDAVVARTFRAGGDARGLDGIAGRARDLRAWLRAFVERHAGQELDGGVIAELAPLNRLLAAGDGYVQVQPGDAGSAEPGLAQRRLRRWTSPEELLQPVALAIADLVCHADFRLIRACEGAACTLLFLDRTKAHARRWCSMAVCGNRAKVAAYRARALESRH